MKKTDIKNSSDMFLYKALIDLNSAKYLLDGFKTDSVEIDIDKIYFELQQSAEKILKSILSKHLVVFPKSHDIELLIELCLSNNILLVDNIERLIGLGDYAVEGRYSIINDDINDSDSFILLIEALIERLIR